MAVRVGINGFGRIGRGFFRAALDKGVLGGELEVVAVNDIGDAETMAYLLEHDSIYRSLGQQVAVEDGCILAAGQRMRHLQQTDPLDLPWGELEVDVVLESTGKIKERDDVHKHVRAGARKAVISSPGKDPDVMIVLGVNDGDYDESIHDVISMASCTTNCLAPMAKVLHDSFGVERGFMTTVHAYTGDQRLLDAPHKDLRRARAAALSLVPTSTGAARAIGVVLPELKGRLDGISVRAPIPTGSLVDLAVELGREASPAEINAAFQAAALGDLSGYLLYSEEPLVSADVVGSHYSCVFDSGLTMASGTTAKVFGWYDNEYGYCSRLVDLLLKIGR